MIKTGRNDPCPCGSGKRFKQCCGSLREGTTLEQGEYSRVVSPISNLHSSAPPSQPTLSEINQLVALSIAGRYAELESMARFLVERHPDSGGVWKVLGVSLLAQGKDALPAAQMAVELLPGDAQAYSNLGAALYAIEHFEDAAAAYRRALEINPDFAEAHYNLSLVQQELMQTDNAVASCRRALELKPDYVEAYQKLLFCLSHSEAVDAQERFSEHCRFAEQFEAPLQANWPQHTNLRNPDRCLQVGFVSGDLRTHPVANFIEPVLEHLAGYPQLSLHAYSNHAIEDGVTLRLRKHLKHWHPIVGLSDAALVQKIQEDGIDILIDLSGHTQDNRLLTFARKPAPVQITWIGYPNTTGLRAMDYVLKDHFNAPYGAYERYYTEKLARLPSSGTFLPEEDAPPVNELPALSTGILTFGSFNRPGKLGDRVISLWSQVLQAVPRSRLLLGNVGGNSLRTSLAERFARCGVEADRLVFQPRMEMKAYLALHHQVDFILDTFPYTGGTTTNHALWMGVPVLTMTGPSSMQCQCAGGLGRAGLTDWVASDAQDFVRRAVDWAGRLDELAILRAGMRDRLLSSPLRQPETVARGLETALRMMWQRWCEGLPAESFEVPPEELELDFPVGDTQQPGSIKSSHAYHKP